MKKSKLTLSIRAFLALTAMVGLVSGGLGYAYMHSRQVASNELNSERQKYCEAIGKGIGQNRLKAVLEENKSILGCGLYLGKRLMVFFEVRNDEDDLFSTYAETMTALLLYRNILNDKPAKP